MAVPLILLPGTLCDATLWHHQRLYLADVADVQIGDMAAGDTIAATAQAILRTAPPRFALAGLSLGGIVALEVVRQAPERVEHLALLNTSARPLTPEQDADWEALGAQTANGAFDRIAVTLLAPMLAVEHQQNESLVATVKRMADTVGPEAFLRQVQMQLSRRDNRTLLQSITCPTLVIAGRQDATSPLERQIEMVAALPNAALVVIEECGHLSAIEQPVAVTALLRSWLATSLY